MGVTMAALKDLVAAKDELFLELVRKRRRKVALERALTLKNARMVAGRSLHAVGVGYKEVKGRKTRTRCVRLYVVQKLPNRFIPGESRLPKSIAGLPTDVIEWPVARFLQLCSTGRRRKRRPILGGVSAAHRDVLRTTLGCLCRSTRNGEQGNLYILGCNHGFANLGQARVGDPILQQSAGDGGTLRVARLARWVTIQMGYAPNFVDAAIAKVLPSVGATNEICTIGPLAGVTTPALDMIVCKHGRTTGYTEGLVFDPSVDSITFPYGDDQFATFRNQIGIATIPGSGYANPSPEEIQWRDWFCAPGDSGSVIVDKASRCAVGLLFAGAAGLGGYANSMVDVCRLLRIALQ